MLAGQRADVEQPRFDLFEPRRVERQGVGRAGDAVFGVARLDHRAVERCQGLGQQGMVGRAALDPPRRLAQQRDGALRPAEQFVEAAQRFAGLHARLHRGPLFGQASLLAVFGREAFDLLARMLEIVAVALGVRRGGARLEQRGFEARDGGPGALDRTRLELAEGVEQRAMAARIEQAAIVVLAVDLDQQIAKLADQSRRNSSRPDEGAAAAVAFQCSADDQRFAGLGIDPLFAKDGMNRMARRKRDLGGDRRLTLAGPDETGIGAGAKRQAERVEQDRLARAGFAGEHAEPGLELELEPVDQHDVVDGELP